MADEISAGKISIDFQANLDELKKGFAEAQKQLTGLASAMTGGAKSADVLSTAAGVTAGILGSQLVDAALSAAKSMATFAYSAAVAAGKSAEQFQQLSQRTGIAVDALQGLQVAMARQGIEATSLAQGFRTLSKQMVDLASGTKEASELFRTLGISTETVARGTGATLAAIADKFAGMADGAEKSRFAIELFGRSGLQLIPILNQGAAGLDAAMKKAAEFGLILNKTQQTALTTFDDALDDLGSALKGFSTQVGAAFAPSLTALVNLMTNAIVVGKNVFNAFADAADKLTIRLGAMAASFQLIAAQLFSFSVFSREAWQQTLDQVKAIDDWAASQIQAVDATRAASTELDVLAKAHLQTSEAIKTHTDHQKILGEQIVATTTIQLGQVELLKRQQERMGADIVGTTKVQLSQRLQESKKFFEELMNLEEQASKSSFLAGPEPGVGSAKAQELAAQNIIANSLLQQKIQKDTTAQAIADEQAKATAIMDLQNATFQQQKGFFADIDSVRQAALNKILADVNVQKNVEAQLYKDGTTTFAQYQDRLVNLEMQATAKRMGIVQQYPSFFQKQMQDLVASNTFSLAQITSNFTNATAQWIVAGTSFKQFWQSLQVTLVQAALNTLVQMGANFAISLATQRGLQTSFAAETIATHTGMEAAKTEISAAADTTRTLATVFASKAAGAASLAIVASNAMAMLAVMDGLVIAIAGVFAAMGAALAATIVGAPFAPAFEVAAGAVIVGGTAAIVTATGAITAALSAAGAAALGPGFAKGGIAFGPSIFGEGGTEAAIPLNDRGAKFMQQTMGLGGKSTGAGTQTTIVPVYLNGREIARATNESLPSEWRRMGVI